MSLGDDYGKQAEDKEPLLPLVCDPINTFIVIASASIALLVAVRFGRSADSRKKVERKAMTGRASKRMFIGIPILNRLDLLVRCLDRIDAPADLLIVNNNSVDEEFRAELGHLASRRGLEVHHQERNLGVAASWNHILATGIGQGHEVVFIGSNDTLLHPGALTATLARIQQSQEQELLWQIRGWNFFAIHTLAVSCVGWFDENFYPAYREDQDYSYRCALAGVNRINLTGAEHLQSQTIRSDPEYWRLNSETHDWNTRYYESKWGGLPGAERFSAPFGRCDRDWRWWPDPGDSIGQRDWDRNRRLVRRRE